MSGTATATSTTAAAPTAARRGLDQAVPAITRWSGELVDHSLVVDHGPDGARIAYDRETPADRVHGVLVLRCTGRQGLGEPLWEAVHFGRQARQMDSLLCRVCERPADRTDEGTLWLLPRPTTPGGQPRTLQPGWPEGAVTEHPPICAPHALSSPRRCPALRGARLVRSFETRPFGVAGLAFDLCGDRPDHPVRGQFAMESPDLHRVAATHLLRTLAGCSTVSERLLKADLARRGKGR
ncbi:hypothetical protein [Kitasatospora sp. NPDC059327]|uniref:hypothetical protein n=1 Tax=Kitasatospora sp. NPDC059327 TaxID=3346803 RepID=UPI0036A7F96C